MEQYLSFSLQLVMVLVTGIAWDLSPPQSNSNNGVCHSHDEQWEAVHQDDDNNVVTARKHTRAEEHVEMQFVELRIHSLLSHNRKFQRSFPHFLQVLISQIYQDTMLLSTSHPNATSWSLSISDSYANTTAAVLIELPTFPLPRGSG